MSQKKKMKKIKLFFKQIIRIIVRFAIKLYFVVIYRVKVIGQENIPKNKKEPLIYCGNHRTYKDPPLIVVTAKRHVRFLAKEELRKNKFFAYLGYVFDSILVKRDSKEVIALKESLKTLKNGDCLALFPEGTRNGLAKGEKVKDGAAFFAVRTGAKVIPVGISGGEKPFKQMTIRYGKPMDFSDRDKNDKEKYFDNDEMWDKAENELRKVLTELNIPFYEAEGEAAFYGPKLDVQVKSAIGHDVTLSTCQLDFLLPERFELTYIDEEGKKVRPVVIHRAILGSLDRFIAFLLEETKGALPLWLAPVQVNIIPVSSEHQLDYAYEVKEILEKSGIRVEVDARNEKLGYRMRESQTKKIPYTLVLGDNEKENKTVTYRKHGSSDKETLSIDDFKELVLTQIEEKTL